MEDTHHTTHTPPPARRRYRPLATAELAHQQHPAALASAGQEAPRHLLLEGRLEGSCLEVLLPHGERWLYTMAGHNAAPLPVYVVLDLAAPATVLVHRPALEGLHPFLGTGRRYGVERGDQ